MITLIRAPLQFSTSLIRLDPGAAILAPPEIQRLPPATGFLDIKAAYQPPDCRDVTAKAFRHWGVTCCCNANFPFRTQDPGPSCGSNTCPSL